jgi:chaperonin GroEL
LRKASFRVAASLARADLILSRQKADNDDQRFGIEIVRQAIRTRLRQIAEKAGEEGAVIAGKTLEKTSPMGGMPSGGGGMGDMDF